MEGGFYKPSFFCILATMKNRIIILIIIGWALIISSYFIDSWVFEEVVLWVFLISGIIGILFVLGYYIHLLIKLFKKD